MGRKPIGVKAMSGAERTLRWAERKLAKSAGTAPRGAAAETTAASDLKRKFAAEKRELEARVRELEQQLAAKPAASPPKPSATRPKTAAGRLAAALDFDVRVLIEARKLVEQSMPGLLAKQKGVWSRATYRLILSCLHTDRSASDERLQEAFIAVTEAKLLLLPKDKREKKELSREQQREREFKAELRRNQRTWKRYEKAKAKAG